MALLVSQMREMAGLGWAAGAGPRGVLAWLRGDIPVLMNPRVPVFPGHRTPDYAWQPAEQPLLRADGTYHVVDANQGEAPTSGAASLGDCWLATVLQADRAHVASLVEETSDGRHWIAHLPDARVAVTTELLTRDGDLAFIGRTAGAESAREAIAPAVLEKALAAREGSYTALHAGYASWAFELLHGHPAEHVPWHATSAAREALRGLEAGEPVVVGTTMYRDLSRGVEQLMRERNVSPEHSYWLEAVTPDASGAPLLHLRAPRADEAQPLPVAAAELDAFATDVFSPTRAMRGSNMPDTRERLEHFAKLRDLDPVIPDRSNDPGFH